MQVYPSQSLMNRMIMFTTIFGVSFLILANVYKIYLKPNQMPYLFPLWFCSVFVFLAAFKKNKDRKHFDPWIWFISLFMMVFSYFTWKNNVRSNVIEASLAEPSAIVFICIFSKIFLGTKITKLRFSALVIITVGIILPVLFSNNRSNIDFFMVLKHIGTNFIFCAINMIYELKIKSNVSSIWSFLYISNLFVLVCTSIFLIFEYFTTEMYKFVFLRDITTYIVCICESFSLVYNFVMVFLFKPVPRTLIRLIVSIMSGLYEGIFLFQNVKSADLISFFIVTLGVLLYNKDYFMFRLLNKTKSKKRHENREMDIKESVETIEQSLVHTEDTNDEAV